MRIKVGNKVMDKVTGVRGIAVSRHEYLYGLPRIGFEVKDKPGDPIWVEESRLAVIQEKIIG